MNASRSSREPAAEEISIEPGPPLQELQRRILAQDPGLARDAASPPPPARTILAFPSDEAAIAPLVSALPRSRRWTPALTPCAWSPSKTSPCCSSTRRPTCLTPGDPGRTSP
jgi:hypothetical protein